MKGYAGDMVTISEVKAKLLVDDFVPSRKVKVQPMVSYSSPILLKRRNKATMLKASQKTFMA